MGYYVKRSYASKGAEDLLAVKELTVWDDDGKSCFRYPEVLHIQCKNLKVEKPLSKKEIEALKILARQTGGTPLHVYNNSKHKLVIEEIK